MGIEFRPERPGDEAAIDAAVCGAFGGMDVANLVRLLRERGPGFTRGLSICAWDGDELVGYTGLLRLDMRLLGQRVAAVAVAPVAVVPDRQRQGIGGDMLAYCHERARAAGAALAILNGHADYYRRHGYRSCFGFSKTTYEPERIPDATIELEPRPVRDDDIDWLLACDEREWGDVDFTWPRDADPRQWAVEGVNAVLWWSPDGRRAAYTLSRAGRRRPGLELEAVLGDDPELVRQAIRLHKPSTSPNHPAGWLAREAVPEGWAASAASPGGAALAIELEPGVLAAYERAVAAGRPVGACNWPLPFIMC